MSTHSVWPDVDPRIRAIGVSKLRKMNSKELRKLDDKLYILQDGEDRLAVLLSFEYYMKFQEERRNYVKSNQNR